MKTSTSITISFEDDSYTEDFISDIRESIRLSTFKPKHISVTIDEQEV